MSEPRMIFAAITNVMKEVGAVAKGSHNKQQGFAYRSIDEVYNHVQPLFAMYGVFSTSTITHYECTEGTTANKKVIYHVRMDVTYTFWCQDGSSIDTQVVGLGMDMGDKGANKALAVAHKYAICQLLALPYAQLDPDSETPLATTAANLNPTDQSTVDRAALELSQIEDLDALDAFTARQRDLKHSQAVRTAIGEPFKTRRKELQDAAKETTEAN